MAKLDGKVAIVSGSGRGIGRALALKLAREGARLVINDLDAQPAEEVISLIRDAGGEAVACVGDVTDADFGQRFVGQALETFGGLDIIVNNAGYTRDAVIQKQTDEQFQSMLDVHVTAPFRILRAAAEHLRAMAAGEAAEGQEVIRKVVNISSIAGTHGNPGQVNYSSAKSALVGMTKTLSKEWGRFKVCVNCAAFGLIDTRLTHAADPDSSSTGMSGRTVSPGIPRGKREKLLELIPLGRAGTAEEAADSVFFLCSPDSNYISGQVLVVAGGLIV